MRQSPPPLFNVIGPPVAHWGRLWLPSPRRRGAGVRSARASASWAICIAMDMGMWIATPVMWRGGIGGGHEQAGSGGVRHRQVAPSGIGGGDGYNG